MTFRSTRTRCRALSVATMLLSTVAAAQPLDIVEVQYRDVDLTYAAEAMIEAVKQSTVAAQVTGRVVEVNYDVGDYVKKGQVIVRIDQAEAEQRVAGSEAQVAQAQAAYENAKSERARARELAVQKFISQAALDKAEAQFRVTEAQLRAARAGASQATTSRNYTVVVAPYSGVVSARHVEVGEMAAPGKALMTGFDPRDMRVLASVPQYKVAEVRNSPRAMVEVPSLNRWIDATSITLLPTADPRTHATQVRLNLPETLRDVYPGMFARAYFTVGRARRLVVPVSAVVKRSEVAGVYVVKPDGAVSFRQVRLGEPAGQGDIEILAGVSAGEQVAIDPIKAGMRSETGGQ